MRFWILVVIMAATGLAHSYEVQTRYQNSDDATMIAEFFRDGDQSFINLYEVRPGELQERIDQVKTQNHNLAQKLWQQRYADWPNANLARQSFVSTESQNSLWRVHRSWNESWEQKFYDWVNDEFDSEFFARYNIPTDCADAAMALRWIFARDNGLPIGNHLAGSGILMTQDTVRRSWLRLPTGGAWHEDERFKKAIDYLMDHAYTHTLFRDTYPIEISRKAFRAGSVYLTLNETSGHTRVFSETNFDDNTRLPIVMLSSTLPKTVRSLYEEPFISVSGMDPETSGIRHQRWVHKVQGRWRMVPKEKSVYYSEQQYSSEFQGDFAGAVYRELKIELNKELILKAAFEDISVSIDSRIDVVKEGFAKCQTIDCAPGTVGWEDWSTPSRDKRINSKFQKFLELKAQLGVGTGIDEWVNAQLKNRVWEIEGSKLNLGEILFLLQARFASSDPRVSVAERWGSSPVAIANTLDSRSQKALAGRLAKVSRHGTSCSSPCSLSSEEFKNKNTINEDNELLKITKSIQVYLERMSEESGRILTAELQKRTIDILSQKMSLDELFQRAPFFNSDPNHTADVRWGSKKTFRLYRQGENFAVIDGWILKNNRLTNIETNQIVESSTSTQIFPTVSGSEYIFYSWHGDSLNVFSKTQKKWLPVKGLQPDAYAEVLNDRNALMYSPSGNFVMNIVSKNGGLELQQQAVITRMKNPSYMGGTAPRFVLIGDQDYLIDANRPFEEWIHFEQAEITSSLHWTTRHGIHMTSDPSGLYRVDPQTSRGLERLELPVAIQEWGHQILGPNDFLIQSHSGQIAFHWDNNGESWSSSAFVGGYASGHLVDGLIEVLMYGGDNNTQLWRVQKDRKDLVPAPAGYSYSAILGEHRLAAQLNPLQFVITNQRGQVLKRLPGGAVYYSAMLYDFSSKDNSQIFASLQDQPYFQAGYKVESLLSNRPKFDYVRMSTGGSSSTTVSRIHATRIDQGKTRQLDSEWMIWYQE